MAHFAKLDENNVVTDITVIKNQVILDANGNESEELGNEFLNSIGMSRDWAQCSYNGTFRRMYPHPGCWFDADRDRFLPSPAPYPSWVWNEETDDWDSPVARPEDGEVYRWLDDAQEWELVPEAKDWITNGT